MTDQEDLSEELWYVQSAVAAANSETADAVTRASGLIQPSHPQMDLYSTHDALLEAYQEMVRAIDQVEKTLDDIRGDYRSPTPRQIKKEHAQRLKEQYDGPVLNLALMLLEHNRREWMHQKPKTNGAQEVERHGLTENQRHWLNELHDLWRETTA
ncbi:MAG: hypothetical protein ACOCTH_01735 [Halodesulfurarchaeum sp.]